MKTPILRDPLNAEVSEDWGIIPTMIEGESRTSGTILHVGPNGEAESGIWICTPGFWKCHVTSDEFCHFIEGRCTYTHLSGDVIEIEPDTAQMARERVRNTQPPLPLVMPEQGTLI